MKLRASDLSGSEKGFLVLTGFQGDEQTSFYDLVWPLCSRSMEVVQGPDLPQLPREGYKDTAVLPHQLCPRALSASALTGTMA